MPTTMTSTPAPATECPLATLSRGQAALVARVQPRPGTDAVATRLEDLGFVPGEPLRVVARGPLGGDPIVVQVGHTRFALRRSEAERVLVVPATELP